MKEKFFNVKILIFVLFVFKMLVYYTAVDIPILGNWAFLLTVAVFAVTMYLYKYAGRRTKLTLRVIYVIFTIVLFVDVIYYNYFNQLVSVNQIWQIKNMKGTEDSVKSAIPLMSLFILVDLPVLAYVIHKHKNKDLPVNGNPKKQRLVGLCLIAALIVIAVNPFHFPSFQKINSTEAITTHIKDVVDSTVGKLIYSQSSLGEILQKKAVSTEALSQVSESVSSTEGENDSSLDAYAGIGEGKNLIVIQIESFQNFVINAFYNGQELTPNLNKLLKDDTLYFNHYYTNMGKGNTSDAEFSTQTSLYPVIEGASYDLYMDNDYRALPKLLKEKGYNTSAAIGDDKDFYNRNTVYEHLGYDIFYNEDNLEMDEISGLGLSDQSMFRQMSENLKQQKTPFYSFLITLTNHYPYVMDDPSMATLELKAEDEDTMFGNYLQTIHYTDAAIGAFIDQLKANGIYDNTVIAMYGDHHGLNCLDEENYEKMTQYLGYAYDYDCMLNIPLVIHIPGLGEAKTVETVGGQVDFLPTIANMFNLDLSESVTFGQDLLNADSGYVATVAYMLQGSFFKDGIMYEVGRDGSFENGRAVDLNTHQEIPLNDELKLDYEKALTLTETSKYILEHNQAVTADEHLEQLLETTGEALEESTESPEEDTERLKEEMVHDIQTQENKK